MKRVLFILSFIAILSSCNSDDDTPQETNFYALTVGNSWVYKSYKYNQETQIYEDSGVTDSISIVDTEDIYGNTFYKFKRITTGNNTHNSTLYHTNGESFYHLRENDGNLISSSGKLFFTNNNYEEILLRTRDFFTIYSQLQENTENVTTDAGTFDCIYAKRYVKYNETGELAPAEDKYHYKKGIGLIQSTLSYVSYPIPVVKRSLVSFNIQ